MRIPLHRPAAGKICLNVEHSVARRQPVTSPSPEQPSEARCISRLLKKGVARPIFLMFASATRGSRGGELRYWRGIRCGFSSSSRLRTDSSWCRQNLRNANEIVGRGRQDKEPLDQNPSAVTCLAQPTDGLDPAKGLFDPLTFDRADAIAGMASRACVDRRAAVGIVLRHMRRTATLATAGHELGSIIVLVGAHRAA